MAGKALLALALLYLVSHAACLPTSLGDVDAINFALGVRDFDIARHQPHPPGYPVFIAAAKASTAAARAAGVAAPEVRGLALLSAVAGAALIPLLFWLTLSIARDTTVAVWAAVLTALSPLVWFNAVRPLSDLTGLAAVVGAQALFATVIAGRGRPGAARALLAGAFVAGLAVGIRSQSFVLTFPLLALALAIPGTRLRGADRIAAVAAAAAGGLLWGLPLLLASGGLDAYLGALRNQAGEDFGGVVMLWTARSARAAIDALARTFLWPWGAPAVGVAVVVVAAGGAARMLRRQPLGLAIVAAAFVPYAAFHLLFQETLTTRYALPLVVPVTILAVYGTAGAGRLVVHAGGAALALWCVIAAVPSSIAFATEPTPASRAVQAAVDMRSDAIAMHAALRRTEQWYHDNASGRVIRSPHGRELPTLVEYWRGRPDATVTFLADPRRSDLALLDRNAALSATYHGWTFDPFPLLGGIRPGAVTTYVFRPPGWMLDAGWAVTAEVAGQSARAGASPDRGPVAAWLRERPTAATLMIGGRHFGAAGGSPAMLTARAGERVLASAEVAPGVFLRWWDLPAGALGLPAGPRAAGYLRVDVSATFPAGGSSAVALEQFDVQSPGIAMAGFGDGWHEPEYEPVVGRTWRWMSDRARLAVRGSGRDVTLAIAGESPLRYFDAAPTVRVAVGGRTLAQFSPAADFTERITIPASLLSQSRQEIVLESDRAFVPGGDRRRLALRIYSVTVH